MIDKVLAVKIAGLAMNVGGMLALSWSGKKEQDATLEKVAKEFLENKNNKGS